MSYPEKLGYIPSLFFMEVNLKLQMLIIFLHYLHRLFIMGLFQTIHAASIESRYITWSDITPFSPLGDMSFVNGHWI